MNQQNFERWSEWFGPRARFEERFAEGWRGREHGWGGHGFGCHKERGDRPGEGQERGSREGFERGFGGFGPGGWEGREGWGRHGRGFRGERGPRLFDAGDIKLVVLKLLSEQPSYGYQLIKTMEQRLSGGYTPSAGVIYPTLTLLEEEGLTSASTENGKKVYSVTAEGTGFLEAHKGRVEELFARLEETSKSFERGRSPEIMRAFMDLRGAVMARMSRGSVTAEQISKITEAIKAAAKAIDEF